MASELHRHSTRELRRYSRHLLIPEIGLAGQERLAAARVLCIGAGGLGSPILTYLAAAGVGRIGVVDDDRVDETNLQRQILYATSDIGRPKVEAARERLHAINPHVNVDPIPLRFDASNARELVRLYDIVVDGSDTFETRYVVNDACVLEAKPDVYGSIYRFDGQLSIFAAPGGPCYRCLFPLPPPAESVPSCADGGVLGVLAGMIGTWQAAQAINLILAIGDPLIGRLVLVDALGSRVREVRVARDPQCPVCGEYPTITQVSDAPPQAERYTGEEIEPADLDAFLIAHPAVRVLDVREPHEALLGVVAATLPMPASELERRLHELDSATPYVVACRVGLKSAWALARLKDAGFERLYHLRGGLLAYAARNESFEAF